MMTNYFSAYFLPTFSLIKEKIRANSELLVRILVLLIVPFNTLRAVQVVYAQMNAPTNSSVAVVSTHPNDVRNALQNYRQVGSGFTQIQFESRNDIQLFASLPTQTSSNLIFQGPDTVFVPILLYHRIDESPTENQFYVSPEKFEEQMKLLHDWGYTTITTELLVQAIREGASLPPRPIILTFDDGHLNNYNIAYPIMKKYGFSGVLYIVGQYMGTLGYMNTNQIKEMAQEGWEVGSHSMNHLDLMTLNPQQLQYEIAESREYLESELGVSVRTFAYPFGNNNLTIVHLTYSAGYIAAVGTGYTYNQGTYNLFALQRRGVKGTQDIYDFASFLPWQGDSADLIVQDPANTLP